MSTSLLTPVRRGAALGRTVLGTAERLAAPVVAPLAGPVTAGVHQATRTLRHAPAVALGAVERLGERLPAGLGAHLPASQGDVAALDQRLARLEAAVARPAARPRRTAASAGAAPKTTRTRRA